MPSPPPHAPRCALPVSAWSGVCPPTERGARSVRRKRIGMADVDIGKRLREMREAKATWRPGDGVPPARALPMEMAILSMFPGRIVVISSRTFMLGEHLGVRGPLPSIRFVFGNTRRGHPLKELLPGNRDVVLVRTLCNYQPLRDQVVQILLERIGPV